MFCYLLKIAHDVDGLKRGGCCMILMGYLYNQRILVHFNVLNFLSTEDSK